MVVENAFGRLKGRWKYLLKRLDIQMKNATTVVARGMCCPTQYTVNGERFAGLNFHVFHGFQEYRGSFSVNISASL